MEVIKHPVKVPRSYFNDLQRLWPSITPDSFESDEDCKVVPEEYFEKKRYLTVEKIKRELEKADKRIRKEKESLYNRLLNWCRQDYRGSSEEVTKLYETLVLRNEFYKNQIEGDVNSNIHNNTVFVAFDGVKGAGKSSLAEKVTDYLLELDPYINKGKSGAHLEIPLKTSGFVGEGLSANLVYHQRKMAEKERVSETSLELDLYTLQFALSLTRLAYEQPLITIFDRSYITSLAKAQKSSFDRYLDGIVGHPFYKPDLKEQEFEHIGSLVEAFFYDRQYQYDHQQQLIIYELEQYVKSGKGKIRIPRKSSKVKFWQQFCRLNRHNRPFVWFRRHRYSSYSCPIYELCPFPLLSYLLSRIKGRYVLPDLSVIMLANKEIAEERQEERREETGRPLKEVGETELNWFNYFRGSNVIPNALYLENEPREEQFRQVVLAIKERFEDKGTRPGLVKKITNSSIARFYKENPLPE